MDYSCGKKPLDFGVDRVCSNGHMAAIWICYNVLQHGPYAIGRRHKLENVDEKWLALAKACAPLGFF